MNITLTKRDIPPKKTVKAIYENIVNSKSIQQIPKPSSDFRLNSVTMYMAMDLLLHLAAPYKMHRIRHTITESVG